MFAFDWSTPIIAVSAAVQATAAALIWWLTRKLVNVTSDYVDRTGELAERTGEMADEMKRTNDLTRRAADQATQAQAPVLIWSESDQKHSDNGDWDFAYAVKNFGISPAYQARLHTEWGEARADEPVTPRHVGDWDHIWLHVPGDAWDENRHPAVRYATYADRGGTWWHQDATGALPQRLEEPPRYSDGTVPM